MKRLLTLLICLSLLAPAAALGGEETPLRGYAEGEGYIYVNLGRYPQTKEGEVQPILWRVLVADAETAYLCSEYILFARELHHSLTEYAKIGSDFGQTDLCKYLNGEFSAEAFTEEELQMLQVNGTFGKVFLLTSQDVKNQNIGMGEKTNTRYSDGLRAWGTPYAAENGLFVYLAKYGKTSPYWVLDQSTTDKRHGRCTKASAVLGHIECGRDNEGVRPAVYLDMNSFMIAAGSGTKDDPYLLTPKEPQAE